MLQRTTLLVRKLVVDLRYMSMRGLLESGLELIILFLIKFLILTVAIYFKKLLHS